MKFGVFLPNGSIGDCSRCAAILSGTEVYRIGIRKAGWESVVKARKSKELGQYIVVDPDICHGQPTFKGTRIMVKSVLEMLVKGWDWGRVSAAYDGRIDHAAIA